MKTAHGHGGWLKRDGFARVAFWQFMAFLMLLLLIWVNEFLDLSALWFDTPARPPDWFRAWALTIGTVVAAIIAVGHTYEQQRRVIRGLLTVCAECHRIRVAHEVWEQIDEYISEHSLALITHGLCPECFERMKGEISNIEKV